MSIFFKLRQCFEKDWNESLYWKRRLYVQSHQSGGLLTYLRLMLLRRTEAQKCSTTGLSLGGSCLSNRVAFNVISWVKWNCYCTKCKHWKKCYHFSKSYDFKR